MPYIVFPFHAVYIACHAGITACSLFPTSPSSQLLLIVDQHDCAEGWCLGGKDVAKCPNYTQDNLGHVSTSFKCDAMVQTSIEELSEIHFKRSLSDSYGENRWSRLSYLMTIKYDRGWRWDF